MSNLTKYEKLQLSVADYIKKNTKKIDSFSNKWNEYKSNGSSMVVKSLSLPENENILLLEFCKKNNMSVGDFIRFSFYHDGAFSLHFLAGLSVQKRINLSFASFDESTFIKTPNMKWVVEKYAPTKVKSIPIPAMMLVEMNSHLSKYKYPSWTGFVRSSMLKFGALPSSATKSVNDSLHHIKSGAIPVISTKSTSVTIATSTPQGDVFLWNLLNTFTQKNYKMSAGMFFKLRLISENILISPMSGYNRLNNTVSLDRYNSILSLLSDSKNSTLPIYREDIETHDKLTPNKNVSISLISSHSKEIKDYLAREKCTLYSLFDKYIYKPMRLQAQ